MRNHHNQQQDEDRRQRQKDDSRRLHLRHQARREQPRKDQAAHRAYDESNNAQDRFGSEQASALLIGLCELLA